MELHEISSIGDNVKVAFTITIAEKVFSVIREDDNRYTDGREALDKCWEWSEDYSVSGDDL